MQPINNSIKNAGFSCQDSMLGTLHTNPVLVDPDKRSLSVFPLPFKLPKFKFQAENTPNGNTSILKKFPQLFTLHMRNAVHYDSNMATGTDSGSSSQFLCLYQPRCGTFQALHIASLKISFNYFFFLTTFIKYCKSFAQICNGNQDIVTVVDTQSSRFGNATALFPCGLLTNATPSPENPIEFN